MVVIGVCGFQGAGKDTLSDHLVNKYGFVKFSFASATKDVLAILFGWDRKMLEGDTNESRKFRESVDEWWGNKLGVPNLTPRKVLQMIGTDLFRKHFNNDIWVSVVEKKIIEKIKSGANVVVSDCRFPNEFEMIKRFEAKIIHVHKILPVWFSVYKSGIECEEASQIHVSETAWIRENFDHQIENISSIEDLHVSVDNFLQINYPILFLNELVGIKTNTHE